MELASRALLEAGLRAIGIEAKLEQCHAIMSHLSMVAEWNERVNLTAITEEREMVIKHALDSAFALKVGGVSAGMRVLDVGTGAGFPGVTWKCLVPGIQLVLLESLQKRCKFLVEVGERVIAPLNGKVGYQVLWGRAEDAGQVAEHREQYDVVTARAVADLRVLAEYCLPFVRVGGHFIALKGPGVVSEVDGANRAIQILGGRIVSVEEMELPEGAGSRSVIRIQKALGTPKSYPRRAGTPAKSPL